MALIGAARGLAVKHYRRTRPRPLRGSFWASFHGPNANDEANLMPINWRKRSASTTVSAVAAERREIIFRALQRYHAARVARPTRGGKHHGNKGIYISIGSAKCSDKGVKEAMQKENEMSWRAMWG